LPNKWPGKDRAALIQRAIPQLWFVRLAVLTLIGRDDLMTLGQPGADAGPLQLIFALE
jgi:hypothetical protein